MAGPLALDRDAIFAACERYGVKRLVVFGSAVTDRFHESSSDVDFLVEFRNDLASRFDAYFGLKESLEALLRRPVDLCLTSRTGESVLRGFGRGERSGALCGLKPPGCFGTPATRLG
jgi:uncharacterized protein